MKKWRIQDAGFFFFFQFPFVSQDMLNNLVGPFICSTEELQTCFAIS